MIAYTLPPKSARLFTGARVFNFPVKAGLEPYYEIDETFEVVQALAGFTYYLERISVTPSCSAELWVDASDTDIEDIPSVQILDVNGYSVNGYGVPIVSPLAERPLELWISQDTAGVIRARVRGKMFQTSELVTAGNIKLAVSITGYELASSAIAGAYRSGIESDTLKQFRGA